MKKPIPFVIKLTGETRSLLSGPPKTAGIRSGKVVLEPGKNVGQHNTKEKEELIVILEGSALVSCAGCEPLTVGGGSMVYMPPHKEHDVENIGSGVLEYIYITSPISRDTI